MKTRSATPLDAVTIEPRSDGRSDVWIRTNIVETDDGWEADETHTIMDGTPTVAEALAAQAAMGARLDSIEDRLAVLWAAAFPPDPEPADPEPEDYPEFAGLWHPGTIIREDGRLWRNIVTVPLTAPPSLLPGHDGHLYAEIVGGVEQEPDWPQWRGEWAATEDYVVGDHVGRLGGIYKALVPHGAEQMGQWKPEVAATVWEKVA